MATQEVRSMVSETSICNQALSWVGANRIASLEDPSTEGEWCRDNYAFLRDAVMEACDWSFASEYLRKESNDLNDWGFYEFAVPLDWLKVLKVYENIVGDDESEWIEDCNWRRKGRFIWSHNSVIYLYGTKRVTDTGQFSNMFVQALAQRLAADMAIPLTENRQLASDHWSLYQQKIMDAESRDGYESKSRRARAKRFLRAR